MGFACLIVGGNLDRDIDDIVCTLTFSTFCWTNGSRAFERRDDAYADCT
jgi:hypothetical protein